MPEQILEYIKVHPVIGSIIIPILLGILTSFISEMIKELFFEDSPDPETPRSKKVFRWITFLISVVLASLTLGALWDWITNFHLKVLFMFLNISVPFVFYHTKGRDLVTLVIKKMMGKVENTNL